MATIMPEFSAEQAPALRIRRATQEDMMVYFSWANDPDVRRNSFNQEPISLEKHEHWFRSKLSNPNAFLYVLEADDKPVGQIRFDIGGEDGALVAEIDLSVAPQARGKGLSVDLFKHGIAAFAAEAPLPIVLQGSVKASNAASCQAFLRAGFSEEVHQAQDTEVRYFYLSLTKA
jgi:L-amino acid N-acyltransferase YncA